MEQSEPRIQRIKQAPPPPELPIAGRGDPTEITFLGRTNYVAALEEKRFIFGIKRDDRRRNLFVIGKSGTGKTKLLELMLRQDIANGYGLCLIDPKGETIESVLDFVPENRIEDVAILDPSDTDNPAAFNPFAGVDPAFHHQFAHGFTEILSRQFGSAWSPRLEHVVRSACLALLNFPGATLHDVLRLMRDDDFRMKVGENCGDEMIRTFWLADFPMWRERFDTDTVIPLQNKLGHFLSDPMIGNIFRSPESRFDLSKLMQEDRIILVNLARGRIGEANAGLLGSLVLLKIKEAVMNRVQSDRDDFYMYVDEFPNLVTETFESLLVGSRRYGLSFTVVQQHLGQVHSSAQATIMGNMGSLIVFRISGEDAVRLKPEMASIVDIKDMVNLGIGQFYMRIMINGETYDPFSAESLKVFPPPHASYRDRIIAASRRLHAHSKEV